jgi:hypothetical protein
MADPHDDPQQRDPRAGSRTLAREIAVSVVGSIVAPIILSVSRTLSIAEALTLGAVIGVVLALMITIRELSARIGDALARADAASREAAAAHARTEELESELGAVRAAALPLWLHQAIRHADANGIKVDPGSKAIAFQAPGRTSCIVEFPLPNGFGGLLEQRRLYDYLGLNPGGLARVA